MVAVLQVVVGVAAAALMGAAVWIHSANVELTDKIRANHQVRAGQCACLVSQRDGHVA